MFPRVMMMVVDVLLLLARFKLGGLLFLDNEFVRRAFGSDWESASCRIAPAVHGKRQYLQPRNP